MKKLTLILDADDTLWETNVYYEEVHQAFAGCMEREGFTREKSQDAVRRVEHERVPQVGYAPHEFVRSIVLSYHLLCEEHGREPDPAVTDEVEAIAQHVIEFPIELFDGVEKALPILQKRCRLLLLTKGEREAQWSKLDRSGLASYFESIHIVPEKGVEVLRQLIAHHDLDPSRTWVVGDSPRSDINPAIEAGLGAVHIPYSIPWDFEEVSIREPERVIQLERFSELLDLCDELEEGI